MLDSRFILLKFFGDVIPKVYKQKNGKYVIYLPYEVVNALNLKENDELDFFKFGNNSFIMAKKEDIATLLSRGNSANVQGQSINSAEGLSNKELDVLKKLDTLRYNMRSKQNVDKMLNNEERMVLNGLINKNIVKLFSKENGKPELYSISKEVYDKFLMRNKAAKSVDKQENSINYTIQDMHKAEGYGLEHESIKRLEEKGYIVVQTEAEAASISLALEESIRQGSVIGIRAFNKKFYIMLRPFFEKYSSKIIKMLEGGEAKVDDIANRIGIDSDATRGILYLLAENGDVSEKKRDLFVLI
ncbi:MAG: AbrB/MazE/SpoVT family DNA-binding domain-containing protein [Candidatus Micrarchaeia archaeon]